MYLLSKNKVFFTNIVGMNHFTKVNQFHQFNILLCYNMASFWQCNNGVIEPIFYTTILENLTFYIL